MYTRYTYDSFQFVYFLNTFVFDFYLFVIIYVHPRIKSKLPRLSRKRSSSIAVMERSFVKIETYMEDFEIRGNPLKQSN